MKTWMKATLVAVVGVVAIAGLKVGFPIAEVAYLEHRASGGDETATIELSKRIYLTSLDYCADAQRAKATRYEALSLLLPLAEAGNPDALYELAMQLDTGMCVAASPEDKDTARNFMEEAARLGHIPAMKRLAGKYFWVDGTPEEVLDAQEKGMVWQLMAADAGDANAQYNIGHRLMRGNFIQQDVALAVEYLEKAAKQGSVDAVRDLGIIHIERMYPLSTPWRGLELLTEAAKAGDAEAAEALGRAYFLGETVPRNDAEAMKWMIKAAPERASARYMLARFYEEGVGGEVDMVNAYAMWSIVKASTSDAHAAERVETIGRQLTTADRARAQKIAARYAKAAHLL